MSSIFKLFLIVLTASSTSLSVQVTPRAIEEDYRLPEGVVSPVSYDLELTLGSDLFETNTFTGHLDLVFNVLQSTEEIKIHSGVRVSFTSIKLMDLDQELTPEDQVISTYSYDNDTEILTIWADRTIPVKNNYTLSFDYTAALITDSMYGFYRSEYKDANGQAVPLATTMFAGTYARRAFPCFDEPSYKAYFNIKIKHLTKYTAMGNTEGTTTVDPNNSDFILTTFAQTPVMSTYLVAFMVSDFTCDSDNTAGVPHQICSRDDAKSSRQLAMKFGPKLLTALEQYTGVPYTNDYMTKMDQVAIPDFAAGAMENWGLVTYRETLLLWDENESSNSYKQSVVTTVAHELAHMWFGDLVTTHWWSDTFLNEGFARYFEYFIAHELEELKDWELDKQFVVEQVQTMLAIDSVGTSLPLSAPAYTPTQVSNRFALVSYNKGASILRMVLHLMGEDNFKKALKSYLETHSFGNATPEDLWTSLQEFVESETLPTGEILATVMENWIIKPGYPLLSVSADGDTVTVTQKQFYTDGLVSNVTWYIPITYSTSSDTNKFENTSTKTWLPPTESVQITLSNQNDWIILNNQEVGYYRVDYDDGLWTKIQEALNKENFDGITEVNRAQLVDDYNNMAKAGMKTYTKVLDFYGFLKQDVSYYPWYAAFRAFSAIWQRTGNEAIRTAFGNHILELMTKLIEKVPFEETVEDDKQQQQIYTLLKVLTLTWACTLNHPDCIQSSIAAYESYKTTKERPQKNLRSIIYCNALRHSENPQEDWNFLWEEYQTSELATEKVTILSALGCTQDEEMLTGYLEKSIDADSGIKQQDALSVFSAVYSGNLEGINLAFNFLIQNYKRVSTYYGSMNSLSSLFGGLANTFTKQEQVDKLQKFLDETDDLGESLETAAQSALKNAIANVKLTKVLEEELKEYYKITDNNNSAVNLQVQTAAFITTLLICFHIFLF